MPKYRATLQSDFATTNSQSLQDVGIATIKTKSTSPCEFCVTLQFCPIIMHSSVGHYEYAGDSQKSRNMHHNDACKMLDGLVSW